MTADEMKPLLAARLLLLQARWDPARMQGTGLAFAIDPWLAECWGSEPEALAAARRRHLDYFNTHPVAAWLVAGIVCREEARAAAASGAEREKIVARIAGLKRGLGAALAGIYDSFFWGALRPASAVAGILSAQLAQSHGWSHPLALGLSVALLGYNVPGFWARWAGLSRGLEEGEAAAAAVAAMPCRAWISGLRRAAAGGAIAAFALALPGLPGADRIAAGAAFAAGLALTWRETAPLAQLGLAGLAGMAAAASGVWP